MFRLFSKKVIVVEYPNSVSIYDSYSKVKKDTELLQFVDSDMSLKSKSSSLEALVVNPNDESFTIIIYSINKNTTNRLSPAAKHAFNRYYFSFFKSYLDLDIFSAFSFSKHEA